MTFTPIAVGSLAWGTPVNNALADQDARITNMENLGGETINALGFKAMPFAPELAGSGTVLASGTIYMVRIDITAAETLATHTINVSTAGSTLTAGQNLVGLYDAAGNRVAISADQTAAWATSGEKNAAYTVPYAAAAGTYYLAILSVGTTPVSLFRNIATATAAAAINHGLTAANARWTTGPTAQTTLPASIVMASRTLSGTGFWMGVS